MDIELTRVFIKVVQNSSFTKAAEVLKLPKSTVSKMIRRLEDETGTKLLLRTTRQLTLTAAGRSYFETCLEPMQILENAQKSLNSSDSILSGNFRITAPEDLGNFVIAPLIADLAQKNHQLSFELFYTDRIVDLVREGFDLAVRIGQLKSSALKARKVSEVNLILVAAPNYLNKNPKIRAPKDLENHSCLHYHSGLQVWKLKSEDESVTVHPQSKIISNQMTSLLKMSLGGAGVALVPSYLAQEELDQGRLIRVLPNWKNVGLPVHLISPLSMSSSAKLKFVSEHLSHSIKKVLS